MLIKPLAIEAVCLIEPEPASDERGLFARVFDEKTFAAHGLVDRFTQHSISFSGARGTLRGLHFQRKPHEETKLVRCTAGAIFDVAVDIRPNSPSFGKHVSATLSAENRAALYVPAGFAHGFLTLTDNAEVFYEITPDFEPGAAAGIRYDDAELAIRWPAAPNVIGANDRALPSFLDFVHENA